jgi:hypothetical protein
VTSGGLIQVTLPSITGYVSAKINFALNAPAVGATFPLSIDSTLVQFSTLKTKDSGGFVFQENGGTQIGSWSDTGGFSAGIANTDSSHVFHGVMQLNGKANGDAIFNLNATGAGDSAEIGFLLGGVNKWAIGRSPGESPANFNFYNYTVGAICGSINETTGAWTLGPSSGLTAGHNIRNSSDTTAALIVTNTGTAANSDGIRVYAGGTTGATAVVFGAFDAANTINHFLIRPNSQIYVRTTNWGTGGTAIGVSGNDLTTSPSSRRYKENEIPLSIDSSKIYDIEVKEFDFIESKGGSHDFGAIAEDVEAILPEIVWKEDGQPESIRESKMVWLLLEEMKKLSARLVALENKGV